MFPQTLFFPPVDPNCPCPPTPIQGQLVFGGAITYHIPATPANNLDPDPGLGTTSILNLTTAVASVVTGLGAQPDGALLWVTNLDPTPDTITLSHADVLSSAANRLYLPGGVDLVLAQYESALLRYDATLNGGVGGWLALAS